MSAYRERLVELWPEHLVRIDRRDAPSITGAVQNLNKDGVSIKERKEDEEGMEVFITYDDIRGIADAGWDHDVISN
jgi:hypothetical protein